MYTGRIIVCSALLGLAGCAMGGQSWQLTPSSNSKSAQGQIRASATDNGNTKLKVKVKHLAPPEKLADNATVFVVWARPSAGSTRLTNLGALRIDEDREGKLEAVTPLKEMQVIITPEQLPAVQAPTSDPVLQGHITRP